MSVAAGTVLGGKFVVERVLGEGGMGMVVAATHVELGHRVAIKMMLPEARQHPEMLARFEREARAAAGLSSEHVARVTDVGRFDDGMPFMVMEFLEGEDLEQCIARQHQLPFGDVVRYFLQASLGLGEAHAHGIVHRDVKPSNLFLARRVGGRNVVKVLDFGIAKASLSNTNPQLTRTSTQMGSPQYMSPEQLRDTKSVDGRTDVWSLGAAFYEAITGVAAFPANTLAELHVKILMDAPVPPSVLRPGTPPELERVVLRCLEKDAGARYATMADLQRDLEQLEGSLASSRSNPYADIAFDGTALPASAPAKPSLPPPPRPLDGFAATAQGTDPGSGFAATDMPTSRTFGGAGSVGRSSSRAVPYAVGAVALVAALAAGLALGRRGGQAEAGAPPREGSVPVASVPVAPPVALPVVPSAPAPAAPAAPVATEPPAAPVNVRPARGVVEAPADAPSKRVEPARAAPEREAKAMDPARPSAKKRRSALDPELEE